MGRDGAKIDHPSKIKKHGEKRLPNINPICYGNVNGLTSQEGICYNKATYKATSLLCKQQEETGKQAEETRRLALWPLADSWMKRTNSYEGAIEL